MKRTVTPEWLEDDLGTAHEITASLADLRRINCWFGGVRTLRMMIEEVARRTGRHSLTLLDVGAGSGDVPLAARDQLVKRGIDVQVTLVDRAVTHIASARPI